MLPARRSSANRAGLIRRPCCGCGHGAHLRSPRTVPENLSHNRIVNKVPAPRGESKRPRSPLRVRPPGPRNEPASGRGKGRDGRASRARSSWPGHGRRLARPAARPALGGLPALKDGGLKHSGTGAGAPSALLSRLITEDRDQGEWLIRSRSWRACERLLSIRAEGVSPSNGPLPRPKTCVFARLAAVRLLLRGCL